MEFERYRKQTRHKRNRGCTICGEPTAGRVQINLGEATSNNRYPVIHSTSRVYCEKHAVEVFEEAIKALAINPRTTTRAPHATHASNDTNAQPAS